MANTRSNTPGRAGSGKPATRHASVTARGRRHSRR